MSPRVVKPGAIRREEILDVAQSRFMRDGYAATSVSEIIDAVGLSKGAFYHHFPSKEALLSALVQRIVEAGITASAAAVDRRDLAPTEKLDAFVAAAHAVKEGHAAALSAAWRALALPENLALRHALTRHTIERAAPLLAQVLAEGHASSAFDCPPTVAWARLVLSSAAAQQDDLLDALVRGDLDDNALAAHATRLAEAVARLVGTGQHRPTVAPAAHVRRLAT